MNNLKPIGIKILGDSPVGKTSILNSFIGNAFLEELLPTVGIEKIEKRIKLKKGEVIKLSLLDSSGKVRFREVELKQVRYINGIILVFDFTSKDSFNNINSWICQIKEIAPEKIIVIFGNQIDKEKKEWQVTSEKAKEYDLLLVPADSFGTPGFVRISYCVSNDTIRRSLPAFKALAQQYGL